MRRQKDNKDNTSTCVFTRVYDESGYMVSTYYIDQYKWSTIRHNVNTTWTKWTQSFAFIHYNEWKDYVHDPDCKIEALHTFLLWFRSSHYNLLKSDRFLNQTCIDFIENLCIFLGGKELEMRPRQGFHERCVWINGENK